MNKKGQMGIAMIVILVVGILFTMALLPTIANSIGQMTDKQDASNQSVSTVTAYVGANEVNASFNMTVYSQSDWKIIDCPLTSVVIRNGAGTALTANTDYTLYASNGVFSLLNTTKTVPATALNLTYVDYTFCMDGYNNDSGSRSMLNLILIFTALAIALWVLDKSGIIQLSDMIGN